MNDIQGYMGAGPLDLAAQPPLGLYIHLPWCLKKCPYCDFNSHELGPGQDGDKSQERYLQALFADLDACVPLVWERPICSVFIGGGTPSLFPPERIGRLIEGVRARVRLVPMCEITMEANPGTFERERFAAFHDAGVTRLSIGVQSFNDAHLRAIGRIHDGAQARAAVEEAARSFETFNIDLMYALPRQSVADLEQDVRTALTYRPPHLSVYHLTIEPNTVFAKFPPKLPDEDVAWDMLDRITALTSEAGLERYEVSGYARTGHRCVHNLNYWQFGDYLGIGAGAHGKLSFAHRVVRQVRWRQPASYMDHALAGEPVHEEHDVAPADLPFEYMLNVLRLRKGFDVREYPAKTGLPLDTLEPQLDQAIARGWLMRDGDWVCPTERGFDFLSDVQELFLPESR